MDNQNKFQKHNAAKQPAADKKVGATLGSYVEVPGVWKAGRLVTNETQRVFLTMESVHKTNGRTNIFSINKATVAEVVMELLKLFGDAVKFNVAPAQDAVSQARAAVENERELKESQRRDAQTARFVEETRKAEIEAMSDDQCDELNERTTRNWVLALPNIAGVNAGTFFGWPLGPDNLPTVGNGMQIANWCKTHGIRVATAQDLNQAHQDLMNGGYYIMTAKVKRSEARLRPVAPYQAPLERETTEAEIQDAIQRLRKYGVNADINLEKAQAVGITQKVFEILMARFAAAKSADFRELKNAVRAGYVVNDQRSFRG